MVCPSAGTFSSVHELRPYFEGVALSGKSGKLHAQIHDYQKKISQSTSLAELKVTLCDALLLLLESNENNYENYKKEIQVVMRYVNVHYKEHITLDQIAEEANLNKSYLCRLFKKEYGDSVFNYLNMIRMEKLPSFCGAIPDFMCRRQPQRSELQNLFTLPGGSKNILASRQGNISCGFQTMTIPRRHNLSSSVPARLKNQHTVI